MVSLDAQERERRRAQAHSAAERLTGQDVVGVAVTWVDNSGITRVKSVPPAKLENAATWGIGATPAFDAFLLDDSIMSGRYAGSPVGDLRLHPDLDRLTLLAAQPGWAWAPADRYTQDGEVHPQCARSLARAMTTRMQAAGFETSMAFEVEWTVGKGGTEEFEPACAGPAYGMTRLVELSGYSRDVLTALAAEGVDVDQFHPEYGAGQLEVSVAAQDPVSAADTAVLVRETIRAVGMKHGLRTSFSPKVLTEGVGNGAHVHVSLRRDGTTMMSGGPGPSGLHAHGASFTAGVLARVPALLAVGCPTAASYLRLIPSHWAGAYACWGLENREVAVRLVTGPVGSGAWSANVEVKCFDGAANPYLVVAGLLAAGLAGIEESAELPEPVDVDPASLDDAARAERTVERLPGSLGDAADRFEADPVLTAAFGTELAATIVDLRRAEVELTTGMSPEDVVALTRWKH
ncbi:MAG: glutamine synthetase [Geodermatophilaceae bacterium]|nr:glutamine synthetase [Geodermatophilaceae bacterium]